MGKDEYFVDSDATVFGTTPCDRVLLADGDLAVITPLSGVQLTDFSTATPSSARSST